MRTLSRSYTKAVNPYNAARVNKLTLEPKFMMPEAGLNPRTMAETAAFDAKRKPAWRWSPELFDAFHFLIIINGACAERLTIICSIEGNFRLIYRQRG
jgi:hypothetical protein